MIAKYVDHLINFDPIDSSAFSNLRLKVVISDMTGLWDHWHFSTLSPPPPPNRHSSINFAPVHIFYCATKSNQKNISKTFVITCGLYLFALYKYRLIKGCVMRAECPEKEPHELGGCVRKRDRKTKPKHFRASLQWTVERCLVGGVNFYWNPLCGPSWNINQSSLDKLCFPFSTILVAF